MAKHFTDTPNVIIGQAQIPLQNPKSCCPFIYKLLGTSALLVTKSY